MPELPHGWSMRNSTVQLAGPPVRDDGFVDDPSDDDSGSGGEPLDIRPDSEGWEDAEDDTEAVAVNCLLCDETRPAVMAMVTHCKEAHDFDLQQIRRDQALDFYATIKLVNYIRSEVAAGRTKPDVSNAAAWSDDKFLQPNLQDDALLFGLDEIDEIPITEEAPSEEPAAS